MNRKFILISIDGMRPDGFLQCKSDYIETMMNESYYTLDGQTVLPSVTLPCHMSLFHSVPPERHGILMNQYQPMTRPINGLFEQLHNAGALCAIYYGWSPLRDVARPESLHYTTYIHSYSAEHTDTLLTDAALECIHQNAPDFVFLYMVETDEKGGHDNGWMSAEYLQRINIAIENVKRVREAAGNTYDIVVTADHGGFQRAHGSDLPECMTIPMFFFCEGLPHGERFEGGSILNIAPTIAELMQVPAAPEWEGKSLAQRKWFT